MPDIPEIGVPVADPASTPLRRLCGHRSPVIRTFSFTPPVKMPGDGALYGHP